MDTLSVLQNIGLSPNEAKIYDALVTYGISGVSTISLRAKVHRRNCYDALQRLHDKGLVFHVHGKKDVTFAAVEPTKLMELIHEKKESLESAMPVLERLYREHRAPEQAFIFKGPEGVKNYLRLALHEGKDMYILGAEGAWFDPRIVSYTEYFLREAKKKRMKLNVIFDSEARGLPSISTTMLAHAHKFLSNDYDTNATMDIFGDYVVTYTGTAPGALVGDVTIFVMYSPELASSYRTWWQTLWDLLPKEKTAK